MTQELRHKPSMVSATFKARFGEARHGWLPLEVNVEGERLTFTISDVPNDFLTELAAALVALLNGAERAEATLSEETTEYQFTFTSNDDGGLLISSLQGRREGRMGTREVILEIHQPIQIMVVAWWRALREVEGRLTVAEAKANWRRGFPEHEMRHIVEHLKAIKSTG
jgi:hypothetical protein